MRIARACSSLLLAAAAAAALSGQQPAPEPSKANFERHCGTCHEPERGTSSRRTRDQWLQVLHGENVLARRYFYPGVHHMEPYRSLPAASCSRLPATDRVLSRVIVLPTGTAAEPDDIRRIGEIFRAARSNSSRLRSLLPAVLPLPTVPLAPQAREAA